MNLEAFILGCGGMMPLPHRHLTSVLLRREGDLFLFDAGEGTQVSLRRLNLRWKKINAIFISHTHADHVTGLPGLLMLSSQVDRDEPLYIYGPPKIAEYVESSRKVLDMYINYEIIVKEIQAPAVCYEGDGFRVRAFPLRHTKTCYGYAFEEDPRPGAFHPERAAELGVPRGPLWSKLQAGDSVEASDGSVVRPEDVLLHVEEGLDILPAASGVPELVEMDQNQRDGLFETLTDMIKDYEFLLLDLGAGISGTVLALARMAQMRVVLVTPEPTSLTDGYAIIKVLNAKFGVRDFCVVVNQATAKEASETFQRLNMACKNFLGFELVNLGHVRLDRTLTQAVIHQTPLARFAPQCPAMKDIRVLAERVSLYRRQNLEAISGRKALKEFLPGATARNT